MIANAYWLRQIAEKYDIQGIDLAVVEECADRLHWYDTSLNELTANVGEIQRALKRLKRFGDAV